jgi:hypothetical protein
VLLLAQRDSKWTLMLRVTIEKSKSGCGALNELVAMLKTEYIQTSHRGKRMSYVLAELWY